MRPEILGLEGNERAGLADERADAGDVVRDLRAVDNAINLLAGADGVAQPQGAVAGPDAPVLVDVPADLEAEFGQDREAVARGLTAVCGQGEDARGLRVGKTGRRGGEQRRAIDVDDLVVDAESDLGVAADEHTPPQAPPSVHTDLAAVEDVPRGERVPNGDTEPTGGQGLRDVDIIL